MVMVERHNQVDIFPSSECKSYTLVLAIVNRIFFFAATFGGNFSVLFEYAKSTAGAIVGYSLSKVPVK